MSRIELADTTVSMLLKMAEGNPGALTVMMRMLEEGAAIDPQSALKELGGILALDTHGVYGSRIWMLYNDVCEQDLTKTLAVLRGVQLGHLSADVLNTAIDNRGRGLSVDDVVALVKLDLSEFGKA